MTPTPAAARVTYRVAGTVSSADVLYMTSDEDTQAERVNLPWSLEFDVTGEADLLVVATNPIIGGVVECEILVNGVRVDYELQVDGEDEVLCDYLLELE